MKNFGAGGSRSSDRVVTDADEVNGPLDLGATSDLAVVDSSVASEPSGSVYGIEDGSPYGEPDGEVSLRIDEPRPRSGRGPVILLGVFSVALLIGLAFLGVFAYRQATRLKVAEESARVAKEDAQAANEQVETLSETIRKQESALSSADAARKNMDTSSDAKVKELERQVETLTKERDEQKRRADEAEKKVTSTDANSIEMQLDPAITAHHVDLSGESWDYWLYRARPNTRNQPLILSLHGALEVGGGLENLRSSSSLARPVMSGEYSPDCIVVCPVSSGDWNAEHLKELVDHVVEITGADKTRLSVTGVSMGGSGTWSLLAKYPDYFATAAPIASDSYDLDLLAKVKTRVLALVGSEDSYDAQSGVDAITGGGGSAQQLWVDGADHWAMCNIYDDDTYNPVPFLLGEASALAA